jgi:hypothetical protein
LQRTRGTQHRVEIEIAMRTAAAFIDERGLGRETRLGDERIDGVCRDDQRRRRNFADVLAQQGTGIHRDHQLLKRAGGA